MFHAGMLSASALSFLYAIDLLIATAIKASGCPRCPGRLHAAHYQRKPRGHSEPLDAQATLRFSWCCGRTGCRHRLTPPSLRFCGAKVYTGPTILALQNTQPGSLAERQLRQEAGCSKQSVGRWRDSFAGLWESATGRTISGWTTMGAPERREPAAVLSLWKGRWPYIAARWQLLIHPLTGGRSWEAHGLDRGPLDTQKMDFAHRLAELQAPTSSL